MKPDKATPVANEHVGWDSLDSADLTGSRRYREHYWVGVASPVPTSARRAFEFGSCTFKCGAYSLQIVLPSVSLHRYSRCSALGELALHWL
jgi:hypothetical protein